VVDHSINTILSYVFGKRKDVVFRALKALKLSAITWMTGEPMNGILA